MNLLKTVVVFLFFTSLSFSQSKIANDTLLASQYFKTADSLLSDRKFDESIELFKKVLPIYENAQAWERVAGCYNKIAENQVEKFQFKKCLFNAKKALEICDTRLSKNNKQKARAYNNIGSYYFQISNYDEALKYYEESLQIKLNILPKNYLEISNSYKKIGNVYYMYHDYDESLKYYEKSVNIRLNAVGFEDEATANSFSGIGNVLDRKGEYNKALEYFEKSINIFKNLFGEHHESLSPFYNNISTVYKNLAEYDKSLIYNKKAIDILENKYGENHPSLIGNYHNMGIVYHKMKMYDKALQYYQKGLSIIIDKFGDKHIFTAHSYNNFGKTYEELEDYNIALDYYLKSQTIYKSTLGENNANIANAYNYTALAYFKNKEYDKSLQYYEKAINANLKNVDNEKIEYDFNSNYFFDLNTLLISLEGRADSFKELFKEKGNLSNLEKSIRLYTKTDSAINIIGQGLNGYKDKLTFAKKAKEVYNGIVEAQILYNNLDQDKKSIGQAFYYSEKSKSNILKGLLNMENGKNFTGLPLNLVELEKDIRINKAFYQSQINKEFSKKENDSAKIIEYENELFDISRRQDSLTEVLEKKYPKYHQLKYKNEVILIADVQQKLDKKTTLLEFFTADSTTYAFTISKNNFAIKELSTPKLEEQIERFRASMTKNYEEYQESSYLLYQRLIAPVKDELIGNQLIIVPDGPLWHLNFDLLLTEEDTSNNPRTWSYLLKDYAISYANSATLLFGNEGQQVDSKKEQECLAFSFSSSGDTISTTRNVSLETFRNSSMDLPGTREEIKAIANIVDGQYFYGSEATEENFKKHAGDYNILHLALHGDVDNERPENSRLYFTKSKDTVEDNYLYSHELFALDIPAELTVLSACNTGTGKIAKGEGIMSLGNAFQYAGTKSLLLTNWEVSDETTPKIMEYFYTNLKEGKNKAEALQQAKLQFLATTNEETYHPYYWGGFYLLGDTTAIQFQDNNYIYWWVGIGILTLILLSLFWYRKRVLN
ncbi:CHAT domain-containing protein [uncultured Aquimarina sp.]|uniref:CHAT domain-containing protein n=1 Tax=uncultured Aquimarina sp. TaxID=575652 RepID=UPI00261CA0BF|nr:CHAT domain-containing protein [uncultured Aquimarina sp.]